MAIEFREMHATNNAKELNGEWFVLYNGTDMPFSTRNCILESGRKNSRKVTSLGTIDPGFTMAPGESVRIVTGNPAKKVHGPMPQEGAVRNYSLFLAAPILRGAGTVLTLKLRTRTIAVGEFDPSVDSGVKAAE